jgi:hypothetical protein
MLLFTSLFSAEGGFGAGAPPPAFTTFGDGDGDGAPGAGASTREWAGNNIMAQRYQVPVAGKVVSVSAWCNSQSASMRMALYSNNGSNLPDALLAQAPGRSIVPTASWEDFAFDPGDHVPVAANDMVWICAQTSADVWGSNAGAPVQTLARRITAQSYASGLLNPFGTSTTYSASRPMRLKIWTNAP